MTSQVLNFLWLNLELPPPADPEDGSIRKPLPPKYIENVRQAAWNRPKAEFVLWVDSKRLTQKQMDYLKEAVETGRPNARLKDLRSIPAYGQEPLYNNPETDPNWRYNQSTMIWRQVDAAKVLVCLQGNYDQTFFADLDHAHLGLTSPEVQGMIKSHGLLIGSYSGDKDYMGFENQLWGFDRSRRKFFEEYYQDSLKAAYKGNNAYGALLDKVSRELTYGEKIPVKEMCLPIYNDGTEAEQPGSGSNSGWDKKIAPAFIPASSLTHVFKHHRQARAVLVNFSNKPKHQAAHGLLATA